MTTGKHAVDISVIVPAYNEEQRLPASLRLIREYLEADGCEAEIIVVDDGSSDGTSAVATAALTGFPSTVLRNEPNAGKGASVRRGMLAAQGDVVLFSDADLSTPIEELTKLLQAHAEGADIAIGSRALADSDIVVHQPWVRETMGRLFNLFVRMFVMGGIHDTQCGFKSFKREVVAPVFGRQTILRWGFDVEILYIAKRLGLKIVEVPVVWRNDTATKVSAGTDGLKMLQEALEARRRHRHLTPRER